MFFNGIYSKVNIIKDKDALVQSLHPFVAENSNQKNFFELGANVLKSIESESILAISKIEKTESNVEVFYKIKGGQPLPEYLSSLSSISDELFLALVKQTLNGLASIHAEDFYHQALNPSSYWVNKDGEIKLSLAETLELRFLQQTNELNLENDGHKYIHHFFSPERKKEIKTLAFSDEYYSFGLIVWYIWCWKSQKISKSIPLNLIPLYETTGTCWDKMLNACLNPLVIDRPNSLSAIRELLETVEKDLTKINEQEEILEEVNPIQNSPVEEIKTVIPLIIENYSEEHFKVLYNKIPITDLFNVLKGSTFTVYIPIDASIEIYSNSDGALIQNFNLSQEAYVILPVISTEKIQSIPVKEKSSYNKIFIGTIIGLIILAVFAAIYFNFNENKQQNPPTDNRAEMIPPDGYSIKDTNTNNLLRKVGLDWQGSKWRFIEGDWEKFIAEEGKSDNPISGRWVKDNSKSPSLLETFFDEIERITTENQYPENYQIIDTDYDSLLFENGMLAHDKKYYRYVNNKWYTKEGDKWKHHIAYKNILSWYFVESELINNDEVNKLGYVIGENIKYRSEPSTRNKESIKGTFDKPENKTSIIQERDINDDYDEYDEYDGSENNEPQELEVFIIKEIPNWYLVKINKEDTSVYWVEKKYINLSDNNNED